MYTRMHTRERARMPTHVPATVRKIVHVEPRNHRGTANMCNENNHGHWKEMFSPDTPGSSMERNNMDS